MFDRPSPRLAQPVGMSARPQSPPHGDQLGGGSGGGVGMSDRENRERDEEYAHKGYKKYTPERALPWRGGNSDGADQRRANFGGPWMYRIFVVGFAFFMLFLSVSILSKVADTAGTSPTASTPTDSIGGSRGGGGGDGTSLEANQLDSGEQAGINSIRTPTNSSLGDILPSHHNYAASIDPQSAITKALTLSTVNTNGNDKESSTSSQYLDQLTSAKDSLTPIVEKDTIDYRQVFKTGNLPDSAKRTLPSEVTRTTIDYRDKFYPAKQVQGADKTKARDALVSQILGSHEVKAVLDKARLNEPAAITPPPMQISAQPLETRAVCQSKKRIILSVNKCGLGNRMVSLASTIMLALLMDRTIELDWISNRYCEASYKDLFHSKPQINLPHNFRPFVYDLTENIPLLKKKQEVTCQVYFDQTLNYTHLSFLSEKALFDRLNENCPVIKIQANIYFAHLLLTEEIGARLKRTFHLSSPFHHISNIVFRPDESMRKRIDDFVQSQFKGEPWLSVHARGYYDDGKYAEKALVCAQKLLNEGHVKRVFFTSETERLVEMATKAIPAHQFVHIKHELISDSAKNRVDSFAVRDDMSTALMEWILIGEATYCTATMIMKSTYSKTSVVNGPCAFIDYSGVSCNVDNVIIGHKKEKLMAVKNKPIINNVPPVPDPNERERIWQTVEQKKEMIDAQCFAGTFPDNNELYKYWGVNEEKFRHLNRTHAGGVAGHAGRASGGAFALAPHQSSNIYAQTPYDRAMSDSSSAHAREVVKSPWLNR